VTLVLTVLGLVIALEIATLSRVWSLGDKIVKVEEALSLLDARVKTLEARQYGQLARG
jgi:hypothetical protein